MATYVCTKKCYHLDRLFQVGDVLEETPNQKANKYFVKSAEYKPDTPKVVEEEAQTLHEIATGKKSRVDELRNK